MFFTDACRRVRKRIGSWGEFRKLGKLHPFLHKQEKTGLPAACDEGSCLSAAISSFTFLFPSSGLGFFLFVLFLSKIENLFSWIPRTTVRLWPSAAEFCPVLRQSMALGRRVRTGRAVQCWNTALNISGKFSWEESVDHLRSLDKCSVEVMPTRSSCP